MPQQKQLQTVIDRLMSLRNEKNIAGMARFGINSQNTLGISVNVLRGIAREIGRDHELALGLWASTIHEARILASLVDVPPQVTPAQVEAWVNDFDSWDVCDQCCSNLFARTDFAFQKAREWAKQEKEFVKRAGFVMIAALTVKDKRSPDEAFEQFFGLIRGEAGDQRNYVKKALNWALRQIGKRNPALNLKAIALARQIQRDNTPSGRWIASDALRELQSPAVQARLKDRK
jgi:3-methyladenine DNA glycosylase AlkD